MVCNCLLSMALLVGFAMTFPIRPELRRQKANQESIFAILGGEKVNPLPVSA
jgi:preprotein translocase subunit YajC